MQKRPLTIEEQLKEDERRSLRFRPNQPIYGRSYELLKIHAAAPMALVPMNPSQDGYYNPATGTFQRCPPPEPRPC